MEGSTRAGPRLSGQDSASAQIAIGPGWRASKAPCGLTAPRIPSGANMVIRTVALKNALATRVRWILIHHERRRSERRSQERRSAERRALLVPLLVAVIESWI